MSFGVEHTVVNGQNDNAKLAVNNSTSSQHRSMQEYHLEDDDGFPIIKLKVLSTASAPSQPTFLEGQPIEGEVVIDSRKAESIKSVTISLVGFTRFSGMDDRRFLAINQTLWKHESVDNPLFTEVVGYSDKMEGMHTWHFSVNLPEYVRLDKDHWHEMKSSVDVRLPPTTYSKSFGWDIRYELVVEVNRTGLLSVDDTLKQSIVYTPLVREPTPLPARLKAYEEGTPLLGPKDDPEGWKIFQPIEIEGELVGTGKAKCTYTLAIAAPLAYAGGGLIPLYLNVECDDENALAQFAEPNSPDVTLYHNIGTSRPGVENVGGSLVLPGNEPNRPLSKAVWSNPTESEPRKKVLYGEIKLPDNLRPTFAFGDLGMQYFVEAYAPTVPGFEPASHERLFRAEVQICSVHYGNPRPKSYLQ